MNQRMPVIFVGHGSPMTAFEDNHYTRGWHELVAGLQPTAVLCVSAHWYTNGTAVTAMSSPRTIHDFQGFPDKLYQFHYPAPGSPALAQQVGKLLSAHSIIQDQQWGFDHGCWAVLKHMFPHADVPVVQLSMDVQRDAGSHYNIGAALKPLRDQGVLIIGSGNVVHNLRLIDFANQDRIYPWAEQFNTHVRRRIEIRDHDSLIHYQQGEESLRQAAMLSVPTPDHYWPLLYVLGVSDERDAIQISLDDVVMGSISMMSVKLG